MNEKDKTVARDVVCEWAEHDMNERYGSDYLRDEFGSERLEERIVNALTAVRQEVWQAAIDEALAFANEDLSNTNVLVLIEQHLKPRLEAAANSVPSEPEGGNDATRR